MPVYRESAALPVTLPAMLAAARRIGGLLRSPGLRARMGHRARQVFEERFTSEFPATALGHLYGELALAPRAAGVSSFRS